MERCLSPWVYTVYLKSTELSLNLQCTSFVNYKFFQPAGSNAFSKWKRHQLSRSLLTGSLLRVNVTGLGTGPEGFSKSPKPIALVSSQTCVLNTFFSTS